MFPKMLNFYFKRQNQYLHVLTTNPIYDFAVHCFTRYNLLFKWFHVSYYFALIPYKSIIFSRRQLIINVIFSVCYLMFVSHKN